MIKCPNCGKEISDKAKKCVHCGFVFEEEINKEVKCAECGSILTDDMDTCPNCGCPIEVLKKDEPQKVEVTNVKLSVNKKKTKVIVSVIIIIILGVLGIKFMSASNSKKTYADNYKEIVSLMLTGASEAESAGTLIHDVWYNTIYEVSDSTTDEYTKDYRGYFNDDFNSSLLTLMMSDDFSSDIEFIQNNQEEVQKMMKDMQNPPEEYEEAYEALKEFYDAYTELVNLAIEPSGNLSSYTSSFNEADSETINAYQAVTLFIEED